MATRKSKKKSFVGKVLENLFFKKRLIIKILIFCGVCFFGVSYADGRVQPKTIEMKLLQCVEAALRNNREIIIERMNVRSAGEEVIQAWADFDPFVTADGAVNHFRRPSGSQLLGATVTEQETLQANIGVGARVPTGGVLKVDFQNERAESNSYFQELNPQYSTALVFSITQPILRNAGIQTNLYRVKLAQNNRAVSEIGLQNVILQTVGRVEEAYWGLVLALENLEVTRTSLKLADEILQLTQAQVKNGILPPVATLQAEATKASREEAVIIAENAVDTAQRNLQNVLNIRGDAQGIIIVPTDRPSEPVAVGDMNKILEEALQNNFQLKQLELQLKNAGLAVRVGRNQLLPRLDLIASFGLVGLSGDASDPVTQLMQTGRVLPDPTGTSLGILETYAYTPPPNPFNGDYLDALDALTSGDYYTWSVGVQFHYPIGNRSARASYSRAMIEEQKLLLQYESVRRLVELAIKNLEGEYLTALKRVEATKIAVELTRRNMEAEKKKFTVGLSTNRDVLETQEAFAQAMSANIKAKIDYNLALGKLERARMGYLEIGGLSLPTSVSVPTTGMVSPALPSTTLVAPSTAGVGSQSIPSELKSLLGIP